MLPQLDKSLIDASSFNAMNLGVVSSVILTNDSFSVNKEDVFPGQTFFIQEQEENGEKHYRARTWRDYQDIMPSSVRPLKINTHCVYKSISFREISSQMSIIDDSFAEIFVTRDERDSIRQAIIDSSFINSVMDIALVTKNKVVRVNSTSTDFKMIYNAVREISSNQKKYNTNIGDLSKNGLFAISRLLLEFFKTLGFVIDTVEVSTVITKTKSSIGKSELLYALNLEQVKIALDKLSFKASSKIEGSTNTVLLTEIFSESCTPLLEAFELMQHFESAIESLLPRVKALITGKIGIGDFDKADLTSQDIVSNPAGYTTDEIMTFINDVNFRELSVNYDIIKMALNYPYYHPVYSAPFRWNYNDAMIRNAISTSSLIEVKPIADVLKTHRIVGSRAPNGKLKDIVLSSNLQFNESSSIVQLLKDSSYSIYYDYPFMKPISTALNSWSNGLHLGLFSDFWSSNVCRFITDDDACVLTKIGVSDEAIKKIAYVLSSKSFVDEHGVIYYSIHKTGNQTYLLHDFGLNFTTSNPQAALFCSYTEDILGKDNLVSLMSNPLSFKKRYTDVEEFVGDVRANGSTRKILYVPELPVKGKCKSISIKDLSLQSFFGIDDEVSLKQFKPMFVNIFVDMYITIQQKMLERISISQRSDVENLITPNLCRFTNQLFSSLIKTELIGGAISFVKHRVSILIDSSDQRNVNGLTRSNVYNDLMFDRAVAIMIIVDLLCDLGYIKADKESDDVDLIKQQLIYSAFQNLN